MEQSDIVQAFQQVRANFPFAGYMDTGLDKYLAIISRIARQYPPSESKILSIGCGPCDLEAILSKLGYDVTGIDDLKDQWHLIGENRERIKSFAKSMDIDLITEPANSTHQKENYFHVVLLIDIIEHLHESPRELLNYSISLLQPGGLLLVETPNAVSLGKRLKVLFGKSSQVSAEFFYWNIGEYRSHVREYTQSELKQILSYHNLIDIDSKMMNIMIIDMFEGGNFFKKAVVKAYQLVSGLYPNFRDTILISGKKPKDWQPTETSIKTFSKYYRHIGKYNLDNEPDEILVNKMSRYLKEEML